MTFGNFPHTLGMSRVWGKLPNRSKIAPGGLWKCAIIFFNFFRKLIFFKLNNFFKTSESTFPVKNWLFHIFPASEGSPFLTVILTVKLAGLPFLQAEEFTDNFQSDKSCQKYTFLLVLCFSGKSYLVIKVIKNVWLFTCSLRLSW